MTSPEPIASTNAELDAAIAIAANIRGAVGDVATLHDLADANTLLYEHMAAHGLDAQADLPAASRVAATVEILLVPEIVTHDDDGQPLTCSDCSRPMAYDYRDEAYRHLIAPDRGCFLIPAEAEQQPGRLTPNDAGIVRLDRLEQAATGPRSMPGSPGIDL